MAKRGKSATRQEATLDTGALTQSPFAALAGGSSDRSAPPAPPTPDEPPARRAAKLVVRREKKGRGGKTVTRISGLAVQERGEIVDLLKRSLGCGATLEGDDVVLLGSLVDRAADWLEEHLARRVVRSP